MNNELKYKYTFTGKTQERIYRPSYRSLGSVITDKTRDTLEEVSFCISLFISYFLIYLVSEGYWWSIILYTFAGGALIKPPKFIFTFIYFPIYVLIYGIINFLLMIIPIRTRLAFPIVKTAQNFPSVVETKKDLTL